MRETLGLCHMEWTAHGSVAERLFTLIKYSRAPSRVKLPVEQPDKILKLLINLKTAKALGIRAFAFLVKPG